MYQIHPTGQAKFLYEVWAEYAIGILILFLRFVVRLKTVGVRGFQGDDYFSMLVVIFFTFDAALVHLCYYIGTNVDVAQSIVLTLPPQDIHQLETGSKLQLVAWYTYTALLWCLKGTMLCFFSRLTIGLWQAKMVRWLSWMVGILYIGVFLTITFGCWPYHNNWGVIPTPSIQCGLKKQNFIVTTLFNVLTDAALLSIPLPLLWKLKLPLQKKLGIAFLLSSGIFVITAAIVRAAFSLSAAPSAEVINGWGVRETIIGILAVNVPVLRLFFTKSFWTISSFSHGNVNKAYEISSSGKSRPTRSDNAGPGSDTYIMMKDMEANNRGAIGDVVVQTTFQVDHEEVNEVNEDNESMEWKNGRIGATSKVEVFPRDDL